MNKRAKRIYTKSKRRLIKVGRGIKKTYVKSKPYIKKGAKKLKKARKRARRMSVKFDKAMFGNSGWNI